MTNLKENSELTNFDQWQQNRFGNILPTIECTPDGEMFESGIEELNRLAEWIEMQAESQLTETL